MLRYLAHNLVKLAPLFVPDHSLDLDVRLGPFLVPFQPVPELLIQVSVSRVDIFHGLSEALRPLVSSQLKNILKLYSHSTDTYYREIEGERETGFNTPSCVWCYVVWSTCHFAKQQKYHFL